MSVNERRKISRQVYQWLGVPSPGQPDADAVMEIISKYADIRDREGLLGELNAHFYDAAVPDSRRTLSSI